ncbi:hypothetical protein BJV77DRAFT_1069631 [Russula vinacea]|nr:hypothetical protein BJV77DRAFT_1069631 [Russula vinacea]
MSPQPYVFPESSSPQLKVIQDYFKYIAIYDFEKLSTLLTEDLLRDSLNGEPFTITVYEVNDGVGKTWVHAKNEPLNLEFVFLFEFGVGPRALKIISFTEFLDSKRYLEI